VEALLERAFPSVFLAFLRYGLGFLALPWPRAPVFFALWPAEGNGFVKRLRRA